MKGPPKKSPSEARARKSGKVKKTFLRGGERQRAAGGAERQNSQSGFSSKKVRISSKPRNKQVISGIKEKCFGIKWCWRLLRKDFDKILNEIPKDRIKIICGEKDFFYCDEKFRKYVQSKGIEILEIKNVGHDWNKKFDKEIEKIINKDRE